MIYTVELERNEQNTLVAGYCEPRAKLWCYQMFGYGTWSCDWDIPRDVFVFKFNREADATYFKLRWN